MVLGSRVLAFRGLGFRGSGGRVITRIKLAETPTP